MRQITPKRFLTVITVILTALTFAHPGRSQSPSQTAPGRDMNFERAIWQELEKIAPKSVETFKAATEAFDKQDYELAATLYRQVMEKAPDFDHVYRRLGSALALSGKTEEGVRYLERAYEMNPSPENMSTLAKFLDESDEGKQSSNLNKMRALELAKKGLAAYQAQNRNDDPYYAVIVAQIAFGLNNVKEARAAVNELAANHPDLMPTHFYLAVLAAHDEDWEKQEILADRVAAQNYGAESFEEGLRHVIRREVEFNSVASKEIEEAAQARRDLNNLYQLQVSPESFDQQMIETQIEDIITRPTTEDDTHPSPIDRFRLAQRIVCNDPPSSNAMVWDLFASRESLTAEMSKLIDDRVKEAATA